MPDTTLTSAELDEVEAHAQYALAHGKDIHVWKVRRYLEILSLARAGLEAGKAEESMRERAATVADDMRNKFGSRTGDAYSNGLWDQGVRIANTIRALPLTTEGGDKP